jgi:XTP/dITP diphosphohydrolase
VGFPPELAVATKNEGKVLEILQICGDWPVRWVLAPEVGGSPRGYRTATWPDVEETGQGYLENALLKARAVEAALGIPAVADDSGIEVDALGGEPGPRSARFAGPNATDEDNLRLLIERIRAIPEHRRTGRYRCVAVCTVPGGGDLRAEGVCEGRLITEPRGSGGFGYDPVFLPAARPGRTMAELPPEEKEAISHRGIALRSLGELLRTDP